MTRREGRPADAVRVPGESGARVPEVVRVRDGRLIESLRRHAHDVARRDGGRTGQTGERR